MIRKLKTICIWVIIASGLLSTAATGARKIVNEDVDWETFLGRHDIVWETLPQDFDRGAFLGNGMLGSTIYQNGPSRLRWEMGRSDVTEHRRDNVRLPIGGLVLNTIGEIKNGTMRLGNKGSGLYQIS